jgi:GMP synthase (glutamine-hydrolysing)
MPEAPRPVLVLDFGAQYGQLIARRIREAGFYSELIPYHTPAEAVRRRRPLALVLSGGPRSVYEPGAPTLDPALLEAGVPVLGICYGMQLLAHALGGEVHPAAGREYGRVEVEVEGEDLFQGLPRRFVVWMSHGDEVATLPPGFRRTARSPSCPVAAMADPHRRIWAVQFHPEVSHTEHGQAILRNFFASAGLTPNWGGEDRVERLVAEARAAIGSDRAIVALSGGVDSAVAAALVGRAVGERLTAVFVDHGLLREGEREAVATAFAEQPLRLVVVDAAERFLAALAGVTDPEEKRRRIGHTFIEVFRAEADRLGPIEVLVQGTLYPDVIESGFGAAEVIKSHHNVGGLPAELGFRLVEPLRNLFKDEVRDIGRRLGLPAAIVERQPFPGPGLAIRMVGEVTQARLRLLRAADRVVRETIEAEPVARDLWQWFAVLPGVRTVGVMGDGRTYEEAVVVRAVTSSDGMTADWARLPHDLLARLADRLVREVPGVNRVLYDITSKPPGTIEWE